MKREKLEGKEGLPQLEKSQSETISQETQEGGVDIETPEDLPSSHNLVSKIEEKRRKKAGSFTVEQKPAEKLSRTKDSITYQEYLDSIKQKNKNLEEEKMQNKPPQNYSSEVANLQTYSKSEDYKVWTELHQHSSKKKKLKKKSSDSTEDELNRIVSEQLSLTKEERNEKLAGFQQRKNLNQQISNQRSLM